MRSRITGRIVLDDGSPLKVRPIRPSDRDAVREAFHRLAPHSRYQRFHAHVTDLRPPMLDYLTQVDGIDHFAVVALAERPRALFRRSRAREIVGIARLIRLDDRSAEIALTVADEHQRKGMGRHLLEVLLAHAELIGTDTLVAHVLPTNEGMLRLLARHTKHTEVVRTLHGETVVARLPRSRPSLLRATLLM